MSEMPTQVRGLLEGAVGEGAHGSPLYLDPTSSDEREAIEYFLDRSDKGPGRYPALHQALAGGETAAPEAPLDRCMLVDAGATDEGTATAQTWLGSDGGAFLSGVHTLLVDRDGGGVLASGSRTQVGGGLVRNPTGPEALAATPRMTAVSFFHAQRSPDEPVRFGLSAAAVDIAAAAKKVTVEEPVSTRHKRPGRVVIGMARQEGWTNSDCDYIYPSAANVEPDRLVVPCSGTAEFEEPVSLPVQNAYAGLWCDHRPLNLLRGFVLEPGFKQIAANVIAWSFPFDNQPINLTESLQFEPLPSADENLSAFFFEFQVPGKSGRPQKASVCSTSWPDKPSSGCAPVEDLEYWWHCIDAQAEVTLADNSRKKLIEIDSQVELRLLDGSNAMVEATLFDIHDSDSEDFVMKLETAGGRSLILSAEHPLMASGAPVKAVDLQPGQEIAVEGGVDQVAGCVPFPSFTGMLGNLQMAGTGTHAYFANGIAVGDFGTLAAHREKLRHDPEYMLARLPESHHQDFLSALADATAR